MQPFVNPALSATDQQPETPTAYRHVGFLSGMTLARKVDRKVSYHGISIGYEAKLSGFPVDFPVSKKMKLSGDFPV
jgi:hypothetical protein